MPLVNSPDDFLVLQSQLFQPLLTGEMLQSLDYLGGLPLDSFQYVQLSLVLRG